MRVLGLMLLVVVALGVTLGITVRAFSQPAKQTGGGSVQVQETAKGPSAVYSKSAYDITRLSQQRVDELAKRLTLAEADVILAKGTERAFCGNLTDNKLEGVYVCRLCGLPLFESGAKFQSRTGWPSFFRPVDEAHVLNVKDDSHGMERTENLCARCGAHLGHVFEDGPKPTGLRFCVNSVSLEFIEKGKELPAESRPVKTERAYLAGGCFWGVEDRLQQVPGVIGAISGYMGGSRKNPTYKEVCGGDSGHAEAVEVVFDPSRVGYRDLLAVFFRIHDPTQLNRQGPDFGTQYRSAVFAADEAQLRQAAEFVESLQGSAKYAGRRIVTQLVPAKDAGAFYPAEAYHQDYHLKHGGSCPLPPE
jgi:peptide methionine sulfoxide reductase msrA/msrB